MSLVGNEGAVAQAGGKVSSQVRSIALVAGALVALLAGSRVQAADARVIVKYRDAVQALRIEDGFGRDERLQRRAGVPLRSLRSMTAQREVLLAQGLSSDELLARLASSPELDYAVLDQRRQVASLPDDERFASQLYLRRPSLGWYSSVNAEDAWSFTGGGGQVVAVLDTGVRPHPDLQGKLLPGYDMISADDLKQRATAADGDGRDPDPSDPGDGVTEAELGDAQSAFPRADCDARTSTWHGTQVAGLIGAATNNSIGLASIGRDAMLLPVRVLGRCGGYDSDIIAGMEWAAGYSVSGVPDNPNPTRIINLSLGGFAECSQAYADTIKRLHDERGVIVFAAAGNGNGAAVTAPGNCAGAVAVTGLRPDGGKEGYANLGPEVAISAPSGDEQYSLITTTDSGDYGPVGPSYTGVRNPDGTRISASGTSFAVPMVSAAAALVWAARPELSATDVVRVLQRSARPFPSVGPTCERDSSTACTCTTSTCGAGMLDVAAAVQAALYEPLPHIVVTPQTPDVGEPFTLQGEAVVAADAAVASYRWAVVDGGGVCSDADVQAPDMQRSTMTVGTAGVCTVRLTITDTLARTSSVDLAVQIGQSRVDPPTGPDVSMDSGGGGGISGVFAMLLACAAATAAMLQRRRLVETRSGRSPRA